MDTALVLFVFGSAPALSAQASGTAAAAPDGNGAVASAAASAARQTGSAAPPSVYDRIWRFAEWYHNDSSRVVQRVLFSGRFQQDYAAIDSEQGDLGEWNVRRMRMGLRVRMLGTLTLHGEADFNPQESDPFYVRLTDMYVEWSPSSAVALTVGKQGAPFTVDGSTSSKELLAVDRSNLANNIWFPQEYLPGVSVSGEGAPWVYHVGLYSAGARNRELGEFSGGAVALGSVGYDFAERLQAKEALASINYVYQNPDSDNTFTRQLQHVVSLNFKFEADRWGLRSDLSTAAGYYGQSDLLGVMAMPFFNATEKFQVVARYTFLNSEDPNGVRLATYESEVEEGRGDRYNEFYIGANYFFYGHKLKLQTGVQFADMADRVADGGEYSGVAWTTGLRIGW